MKHLPVATDVEENSDKPTKYNAVNECVGRGDEERLTHLVKDKVGIAALSLLFELQAVVV